MSDLSEFYLKGRSSIVGLELLEISHSAFTSTKYLVRNATRGVTVIHEDATSHDYIYLPMQITAEKIKDNLDYKITVQLGDLGEIIPQELARIKAQDKFREPPRVIYRGYRSDNLTVPMLGPYVLEVSSFVNSSQGAMFEAKAPDLNASTTGELFSITRFPMLESLVR